MQTFFAARAARSLRRTAGAAAILCSTVAAETAAFAAGVPLSSAAVRDPHELVVGKAEPTPELFKAPWFQESLEFGIQWGVISVGKADMQAKHLELFNGTPTVRLIAVANSNGFCDAFYKVRDVNESWIDARDFSSLGYVKRLREGNFFRDEWVLYDYPHLAFLSRTTNREGNYAVRVGTVPGRVQDILSSLYFIRTKPLKVGDEIVMDVNTRETWPLVVKVLRREEVDVPAGRFKCIVVQPFLRKEGIFIQKGKNLQVWLTDDDRRLPVRMSVEVFFGHVTASLLRASR